jgi:transposase
MTTIDYIGLDIHKKTITFCAKAQDGRILDESTIPARRQALIAWAEARMRPWVGAMEATLFTGWIYDVVETQGSGVEGGTSSDAECDCGVQKEER